MRSPGVDFRFDYVSTFNNSAWQAATGQTPGGPKVCNGGTFANCYSAACVSGAPNTPYMPPREWRRQGSRSTT